MSRVLVRRCRRDHEEQFSELMTDFLRQPVYGLFTKKNDNYDADLDDYEFWEVAEDQVDSFVEEMTMRFPGYIFRVYAHTLTATRPAGEMVRAKVSEEGVLPF